MTLSINSKNEELTLSFVFYQHLNEDNDWPFLYGDPHLISQKKKDNIQSDKVSLAFNPSSWGGCGGRLVSLRTAYKILYGHVLRNNCPFTKETT